MSIIPSKWQRVTRSRPCPVCKRGDWCLRFPDGTAVICARVESSNRRGDAGWLHRFADVLPKVVPDKTLRTEPDAQRAGDAVLDCVYRAVLSRLPFDHRHREHLRDRELTDADMGRAGYRTLPVMGRAAVARELRGTFPDEVLLAVPGIIIRQGQHGQYLTIAGVAGLLIPARNPTGQIIGLIVRPDTPGDYGKYLWVSSRRHGGSSSGARVHVPVGVRHDRRVVLTEGALKADCAFAFSSRAIIGMPGPHVTAEAIDTLRGLGAHEALLALDADATTNHAVAQAQITGLRKLKAAGFTAGLIRWDSALGKGLDDALRTTRRAGR
jgi:hypothetical protein